MLQVSVVIWPPTPHRENVLFIAGVLERFHGDRYRPSNDTIVAFAARLIKTQKTVASTSYTISDNDLYMRLVIGLPKTIIWQTAKTFVLNQNLTSQKLSDTFKIFK